MKINYASNFQISVQNEKELNDQFEFNNTMLEGCNSKIEKAEETNEIYATINKLMNFQSQILVRQSSNKPQEQLISYDNQTIVSTSSVRRKNAKALVIIPMPVTKS